MSCLRELLFLGTSAVGQSPFDFPVGHSRARAVFLRDASGLPRIVLIFIYGYVNPRTSSIELVRKVVDRLPARTGS